MKRVPALLCALLLAVPAASFAAITNDEVTSVKLKEADNNGSQDTNSGSGVKTNHIQNLAVTSAKIADSAVTSAKIVDGAVAAADLATGAVTSAKIADGAVTDAKIATVSASKVAGTVGNADTVDGQHASAFAPAAHAHPTSQVTGLDAALGGKADLSHNHDALYQRKYANVIVVAKSGGDFTDPVAAMGSIADASASNPYLVKIMPGIYDLGSNALNVLPFVDVEGSGEGTTVIRGSVENGSLLSSTGTVNGSDNSEIRFLTVEADGLAGSSSVVGIGANGGAFKMTNVTVRVDSGAYGKGVALVSSPSVMTNVTISATAGLIAYGVYNASSNAVMSNVVISVFSAQGNVAGVYGDHSTATMNGVTISARAYQSARGVQSWWSNDRIANATIVAESTWATEGQAQGIIGINLVGSFLANTNVTAQGGGYNHGVILRGPAGTPVSVSDVNANASGGYDSRAFVGEGSVALTNVSAVASASIISIGLEAMGGSVLADRSTFVGANSIWNGAAAARIGASKLVGALGGAAPLACVASYNGDYAPLDSACQ